jgi:hypothetical protein
MKEYQKAQFHETETNSKHQEYKKFVYGNQLF